MEIGDEQTCPAFEYVSTPAPFDRVYAGREREIRYYIIRGVAYETLTEWGVEVAEPVMIARPEWPTKWLLLALGVTVVVLVCFRLRRRIMSS